MHNISHIINNIEKEGGTCYLVGGLVRDALFHLAHTKPEDLHLVPESKDVDIEVYGLESDKLLSILKTHAEVTENCGKCFAVHKIRFYNKDYDFSLPRKDQKVCEGHKGIITNADPYLSTKEACKRRNFTVNSAMAKISAYMPTREEDIVDHFGAAQDIRDKILKPIDPDTYVEDPLRNLIGLQQSVRFGFHVWPTGYDTFKKCQEEYGALSDERIWGEWEKLLEKGEHFHLLFKSMRGLCLDSAFPEIYKLSMTPQDPEYHPEGNVGIHSALAANWTANYCTTHHIIGRDRIILVLAALLHDIGKLNTTEYDENGRITSRGHAHSAFKDDTSPGIGALYSIRCPQYISEYVIPLIQEHMIHVGGKLSKAGVRRLAHRMRPATLEQLDVIIQADHNARPPLDTTHPCPELLGYGIEMGIDKMGPAPIISGRHILPLGVTPGPLVGKIMAEMFERQLNGDFNTLEEGIKIAKEVFSIGGTD